MKNWYQTDRLRFGVFPSRQAMGEAAAKHVLDLMTRTLKTKERVRVVFGCAPSQDEFLAELVSQSLKWGFAWGAVEVFHMDEYVGLPASDERSFRHYLNEHLLKFVGPAVFHPLEGDADDLSAMIKTYDAALAEAPIDIICMGIGENGHVAFNDPPVADFNDPALVKSVPLDPVCRQQQVNDGCFDSLDDVPVEAVTITVPNFIRAKHLSCVVPNVRKADAVRRTIEDPVGTECPSTLLREHPNAVMFLDPDSASMLTETAGAR